MISTAGFISLLTATSAMSNFAPAPQHLRSLSDRRMQTTQAQIVFNSKGNADQLVTYTGSDSNGVAQFVVTSLPPGNMLSVGAVFGDVNDDGHLDLIRGTYTANTLVMFNDGANGFPSSGYTTIPKLNPTAKDYGVRIADVDQNGLNDIITGSYNEGHYVHKQTSAGVFSGVQLPGSTNVHYGFAVADFNGDSYPDIVFPDHMHSSGYTGAKILMNDGAGNFPFAAELIPGGTGVVTMITEGDFDNDGDVDLVASSSTYLPERLYVNDGFGTFSEVILPGGENPDPNMAYANALSAGFADLDGDGNLDIVIGNRPGASRMLLNDGNGNYPASMDIPFSPTHTTTIKMGDVDGDGDVDLVMAEYGADGYVFLNDGLANFSRQTVVTGLQEPWGLAVLGFGVVAENGGGSSVALPTSSAPTASPSNSPSFTSNPTQSPTQTPTPYAPWECHFLGMEADFTLSSVEEITLNYEIGRGRSFNAELLQEDCSSAITDVSIVSTDSMANKNITFDTLTLKHSVDKSAIAGSTIWDAAASKIVVCQVVQLEVAGMVIAEDKRVLTIDFDLSVDYDVGNYDLAAETINAGNDTTSVDSYVEACKCAGDDFVCNTDALAPNNDLHICIRSVSSDVEIDYLNDMIISQDGASDLIAIEDDAAKFPAFTTMTYAPASRGVVVKTRVPTNMFDYNSPGSTISIGGDVRMQFVGSRRRLQASETASDGNEEAEASFDFEVSLLSEASSGVEEDDGVSSAFATGGKSLVALGAGLVGAVLLG